MCGFINPVGFAPAGTFEENERQLLMTSFKWSGMVRRRFCQVHDEAKNENNRICFHLVEQVATEDLNNESMIRIGQFLSPRAHCSTELKYCST